MKIANRNDNGQFKKGYSGNPSGRPKGSITKILREFMSQQHDRDYSRIQQLCFILWNKALKGDLQAIKIIMDRLDGTPRQSIEHTTSTEPIKIIDIEGVTDNFDDNSKIN